MALNPLAAQVVQLATVGYHTEEFSLASPRKTKKRFSEKKTPPVRCRKSDSFNG